MKTWECWTEAAKKAWVNKKRVETGIYGGGQTK